MVLSPLLINHTQGRKILSSTCPRGRGQSSRTPSLVTVFSQSCSAFPTTAGHCGISIPSQRHISIQCRPTCGQSSVWCIRACQAAHSPAADLIFCRPTCVYDEKNQSST